MPKLHPIAAQLLADVEAYRARSGITRTAFGLKAAGDGYFIRRLEAGRMPRFTTIDRVYRYISRRTKATTPTHHRSHP